MGFERVQFEKKMEDFSAGQKKKVLLAASLCQPAHLYVWDEPLNFVDLHTRLQITSCSGKPNPPCSLWSMTAPFRRRSPPKKSPCNPFLPSVPKMRIIGVDSRRIGVIFVANTFGIYIHIPFCKSKCDYCDFYSLAGQEEQMDRYQRALLTHLRSFGPRMKGWVADTVYFGGGTPSYYGEKRLREILSLIQRLFTVSRQAEITVECNPDSVDWRSMARLRRSGVNRISLGVQSADPQQLRCLHRIHSPKQVVQAVADIRQAKINNLSLDLIYGLPGQTMVSWEDTLHKAMSLSPEHLSCYGLKVEADTPLPTRSPWGSPCPTGMPRPISTSGLWSFCSREDTGSMKSPTLPSQAGSPGTT